MEPIYGSDRAKDPMDACARNDWLFRIKGRRGRGEELTADSQEGRKPYLTSFALVRREEV